MIEPVQAIGTGPTQAGISYITAPAPSYTPTGHFPQPLPSRLPGLPPTDSVRISPKAAELNHLPPPASGSSARATATGLEFKLHFPSSQHGHYTLRGAYNELTDKLDLSIRFQTSETQTGRAYDAHMRVAFEQHGHPDTLSPTPGSVGQFLDDVMAQVIQRVMLAKNPPPMSIVINLGDVAQLIGQGGALHRISSTSLIISKTLAKAMSKADTERQEQLQTLLASKEQNPTLKLLNLHLKATPTPATQKGTATTLPQLAATTKDPVATDKDTLQKAPAPQKTLPYAPKTAMPAAKTAPAETPKATTTPYKAS